MHTSHTSKNNEYIGYKMKVSFIVKNIEDINI